MSRPPTPTLPVLAFGEDAGTSGPWEMFLHALTRLPSSPFLDLERYADTWADAGAEGGRRILLEWAGRWSLAYGPVIETAESALRLRAGRIPEMGDWSMLDFVRHSIPGSGPRPMPCRMPSIEIRYDPLHGTNWRAPLGGGGGLDPFAAPDPRDGWLVELAGPGARDRAHEAVDLYFERIEALLRNAGARPAPDLRARGGVTPADRFYWVALRLCGGGPGRRMQWRPIIRSENARLNLKLDPRTLRKTVKKHADMLGVGLRV